MAATVTANLTLIDDAESAGTWSSGTLDPDFFVQNANSIGWYASKNARGSETVTPATSVAWTGYTYPHLYFWVASSVAAKSENKSTGTTTASGLTVRVTLANSAYREWHVAGADTYQGDWRCFCIDMSHTGTQLYASSGTFSNASNIASVTFYWDLSNSGNIRNVPANMWNDVIRVGDGLTAYSPTSTTEIDFTDIAAEDEAVANKYGILQTKGGVIFAQGHIRLGDTSGTNHLNFVSQDEVVVFLKRDGSGDGLVHNSLYGITTDGNSTATTQSCKYGVKVGTGDTANGRNGTIIRSEDPQNMRWSWVCWTADLTHFTMYGSALTGAVGSILWSGTPSYTFEIIGVTFDQCDKIQVTNAVCRAINVLNCQSISGNAAFAWDADTDVRNALFANNTEPVDGTINMYDLGGLSDQDFYDIVFSGNTTDEDVVYFGSVDIDINIYGGTIPGITSVSTGTATAVTAPVTTTITVRDVATSALIEGARVLLLASAGTGDLPYDVTLTSITRVGTTATVTFPSAHGLEVGDIIAVSGATDEHYNGAWPVVTVPTTTTLTYTMLGTPAANAAGTLKGTGGIFNDLTNASGLVTDTRSLSVDQPVTGYARRGTSSPLYKTSPTIDETIDNENGLALTVYMIPDE